MSPQNGFSHVCVQAQAGHEARGRQQGKFKLPFTPRHLFIRIEQPGLHRRCLLLSTGDLQVATSPDREETTRQNKRVHRPAEGSAARTSETHSEC